MATLILAGIALVLHNTLMVRITQSVSTVLITLVINSSVGLTALLLILVSRKGLAGLVEAADAVRPWALLPGLLGSFFVFAGIWGISAWVRHPPSPCSSPASCSPA